MRIKVELLDRIRDEQALTSDAELAEYLGVSLRTVQKIRKGAVPSLPTFVKIMDAAGVARIRAGLEETNAA